MWRLFIDTGGTFTDCIAVDPSGAGRRIKVLSSGGLRGTIVDLIDERRVRVAQGWEAPDDFVRGWRLRVLGEGEWGAEWGVESFDAAGLVVRLRECGIGEAVRRAARGVGVGVGGIGGVGFEVWSGEEAPIVAARLATGCGGCEALPRMAMRLATTRGTNALLERRGVRVAFFVTEGHADLLRIGTQQRPELFALDIVKPAPLPGVVVEVGERLNAAGGVVRGLDESRVRRDAAALAAEGYSVGAVALLHSDVNGAHEERVREILLASGFAHVSCSSGLSKRARILPRAETAVVDAYLTPVIEGYLRGVRGSLGEGSSLHVMTSAAGLVRAETFRACEGLLSGPAGGVAGALAACRASGVERALAFDMGGTSTDVSRLEGGRRFTFEHEVGGVVVRAPAVAIETVAAGGGSICEIRNGAMEVGPRSAGADPGPACYGAGGPLTITDVNLLLGRVDASVFEIPVVMGPARGCAEALHAEARASGMEVGTCGAMLEGFLEIANQRMAEAIRRISVREGCDPSAYAMVAFGGAGGQHACAVAEALGVGRVVVPRDVSVLSAAGLASARLERSAERQVLRELDELEGELAGIIGELEREAMEAVRAEQGDGGGAVCVDRRLAFVRLRGQEATIETEWDSVEGVRERFMEQYRAVYGYRPEGGAVEVESLRVIASSGEDGLGSGGCGGSVFGSDADEEAGAGSATRSAEAVFGGARVRVEVRDRAGIGAGEVVRGPALIVQRMTTTVVSPGWDARVDGSGALVLERAEERARDVRGVVREGVRGGVSGGMRPRAVRTELFVNRLTAIAAEMGEALERSALSTNVKERLDYSCAVLDAEGMLLVNAPHIPVHLGALGTCVRAVCGALPIGSGDVVVTNHPGFGGSHLPDVTVIVPVDDERGERLAYVANRAHHAEIGGIAPGSMSPEATRLSEEGVVIAPMKLVEGGRARWDEVERLLRSGRYPSRRVDENMADLRAQVAAARHGVGAVRALVCGVGDEEARAFSRALLVRAERAVGASMARFEGLDRRVVERMDDGSVVAVRVTVRGGRARIDFSGSSPVHGGCLNAPGAIVRSAVAYVLRVLVGERVPLNDGLLRAVELVVPEGMLSPRFEGEAQQQPAVAGGNVETSQRVVNALIGALGLAAQSQGTMNNLVFGNDGFGFYETICGGAGATERADGASAVHTHMTNTRITDAELMERRYPVRVERFAVRRGSGGIGKRTGGDGVEREIVFLEGVRLNLLTQHRDIGPRGGNGGGAGIAGEQLLVRADGRIERLGASASVVVRAGDRLIMRTPGGGGWGAAGSA